MPSREELLSIYCITDTDTDCYHVGEIDFGIHGELENYLQTYGQEGKEDLIMTLSYLIYEVEQRYREMSANGGCCESSI